MSYIVFFSTLFAVIGVYVYGATVSRSLANLENRLVTERQRFSVTDIDGVRYLDKRLSTAHQLLSESAAPSRLFPDIEAITASNIYFSGMKYEVLPNRQFQVELTGRANNFTDIISQRGLLGNSTLLKDAVVSDFDYSVGEGSASTGEATLTFVFSDSRDLSSIAYDPTTIANTEPVFQEDISNQVVPESLTPLAEDESAEDDATITGDPEPDSLNVSSE